MGYVQYQRDRPVLNYVFARLGPKGWAQLANPAPAVPDPHAAAARRVFLAEYDLAEYRVQRVPKPAAQDFLAALKKRRVPPWVLAIAPLDEIRAVGGE